MEKASKVLENLITSQPRLLVGYHKLFPNPPLVDGVIDQNLNPINPTLYERESYESIPNQPLVEKMIDLIQPSTIPFR